MQGDEVILLVEVVGHVTGVECVGVDVGDNANLELVDGIVWVTCWVWKEMVVGLWRLGFG